MNKLVSKNPVLRFKLGKKITKALFGSALKTILGSTITGSVVGRYLNKPTNNPRKVRARIMRGPAPGYKSDGTLDSSITHIIWNENPDTGEWVSGLYVKNGNRYWKGSDGTTTLMGPNDGPIKKPVKPLRRNPSRRNPVRSTPTVTESVNHPEDMLPVNDFLSKQENLTLNIPTAPSAYRQAVLGKDYGTYWDSPASRIDDALFLIKNLNRKAELRTSPVTYDRSGTRDWIRTNLGRGAYEYTGAQRRALRYWLNGDKEGQNYDKNLLGVFGDLSLYAKQGAKLVSKNPIERFLQGRNLPTAPKAEDRYKYSSRSSEITPQGEKIKTVEVAPTGYWKFPATILERVNQQNDTTYIEVPTHTSILGGLIRPRVRTRTVIKKANQPYNIGTYLTFTPSFVGPLFSPSDKLEYETLKRRFNTAWSLAK